MSEIAKRSLPAKQDDAMQMTPVANDRRCVILHTDNLHLPVPSKFDSRIRAAAQFSSAAPLRPSVEIIGKSKMRVIPSITPSHWLFSAISGVTLPSHPRHVPSHFTSRKPQWDRGQNKYRTYVCKTQFSLNAPRDVHRRKIQSLRGQSGQHGPGQQTAETTDAETPPFVIPTLILIVEVGLQFFPATGIFLMMLAAPAWSVILVNAILIALAIDAWRGALPRWVIGVPAVLYAGYLGFYAVSMAEYWRLNSEIEAANAGQRMAFNPQTQDIAVDYVSGDPNRTPLIGHAMVSWFNLRSAYDINHREPGSSSVSKLMNRVQCDALKGKYGGPVTRSGFHVDHVFIRNACIGSWKERPRKPTVTLRPAAEETVGPAIQPATLRSVDITGPDGRHMRLTAGTTRVLTLLPMPIIGCTLISSKPSWECFAHFQRSYRALGGDHDPGRDGRPELAAHALGLVPRKVVSVERRLIPLGGPPGTIDPSEIPGG